MEPPYRVRAATAADAAVIARHRVLMFHDMGEQPVESAAAVEAATRAQVRALLESGAYTGWLAELDSPPPDDEATAFDRILAPPGAVVAGLGLFERLRLPKHSNPEGRPEAYLLNVYTERAHRRRGLATMLIQAAFAECRARGLARVALHASREGQAVYARLGFAPTNEMSLAIERVGEPDGR